MTPDLCKQLKEAGFPITHHEWECTRNDCYEPALCRSTPTLEELIEACGVPFAMDTTFPETKWFAWSPATMQHAKGTTPSEAVAMLWLALKGK